MTTSARSLYAAILFPFLMLIHTGSAAAESQGKSAIKQTLQRTAGAVLHKALTPIASGSTQSFSTPPVNQPTLIPDLFSIDVPPQTAKLQIDLVTQTANADLDLYVRFGQDVAVDDFGDLVADQKSETTSGNESITVSATSPAGLQPGTYFIAVGVFSGGITINATITAAATTLNGLVAPQFVDGGGWKTTLFLTNVSTATEGFTVNFYAEDGSARTVPVLGIGPTPSIRQSLNPGQTISFETDIPAQLETGWAMIVPDNPVASRINGFAVFRLSSAGRPDFEAVVPLNDTSNSSFTLLYDNANGFMSGIALANPNPNAVAISATILDSGGGVVATDVISLPPFGHTAFFLSSNYPAVTGQGSVVFSAAAPIAGLGLRFSPGGPFTSFPILLRTNTK